MRIDPVFKRAQTQAIRSATRMLACVILFLVGCSTSSATPLADWTLRTHQGDAAPLHLPAHVSLPQEKTSFTLSSEVSLPPAWRGHPVRVRVEGWQSITALSVGTQRAHADPSRGYRGSGYEGWLVDEELTRGATLPLTLTVEHTWEKSAWLDSIPTIELADKTTADSPTRIAESIGSVLALGTTLSFAFLFGVLFALDRRRREHAWFALFAAASATYPLFVSTWLESRLGVSEGIAFGVAQAFLPALGFSLSRAMFRAPPIPRIFWTLPLLVLAVGLLVKPFALAPFSYAAALAIVPAAAAHFVFLARLARARDVRATIMLVAWTGTTLATSCLEGGYFLGKGLLPFPGFHVGLYANVLLMLVHAYLLAARHVEGQRSIETLNEELRLRVNQSSAELSHALWRLLAANQGRALEPGDCVDERYRIEASLGRGGMGQVWRAVRISDGLPVAIKVVRDASSTVALARFAREARIVSGMAHPNIVNVYDMKISDRGFMYLVMELVEGESLTKMEERYGDARWATRTLRDVSRALVALHAQGIVHRDLKPSNVVVAREGAGHHFGGPQAGPPGETAKLIDFGLALVSSAARTTPEGGSDATVTRSPSSCYDAGRAAGTPAYMPPEIIFEGASASAAGDVYSLAVLAHELFVGELPFSEANTTGRADTGPASGVRRKWGGASPELAELLDRGLSSCPEDRPLARDILAALGEETHARGALEPRLAAGAE